MKSVTVIVYLIELRKKNNFQYKNAHKRMNFEWNENQDLNEWTCGCVIGPGVPG